MLLRKRSITISIFYRLSRKLFWANLLQTYLLLERIFEWLAFQELFRKHNLRLLDMDFVNKYIKHNDKVLDLGCGNGLIRKGLTKGIDYTGIDKEEYKGALVGDILAYVKTKIRFDVAIFSHSLEYLENPKEVLREISSKVGKICIETPDHESSYLNLFRKGVDYTDPKHFYEFSRDKLKFILKECGLKVFDEEYKWGNIRVWCEIE